MVNEQLASAMLAKLKEAFPGTLHLYELSQSLSEYAGASPDDWSSAAFAIIKRGHATGVILPGEKNGVPADIANIGITDKGIRHLERRQQSVETGRGELDASLQVLSTKQFRTDLEALVLAADATTPLSVLFIDLDDFKSVNESYDHLIGNDVLNGIAQTFKTVCGTKGRCYRWGGDEFTILLPNYDLTEAHSFAARVCVAISQTRFPTYPHGMTVSIGVSTYPIVSANSKDLVLDADHAAKDAKRSGKNQVCVAKAVRGIQLGESRLSAQQLTERLHRASVVARIASGLAENFLISVHNDSEDEVTITEVRLTSENGINLTAPGRPPSARAWLFPRHAKLPIAWRANPDPATALINMNLQFSSGFRTVMKAIFVIELLGNTKECECKFWVHVDTGEKRITQLAG